MTPPCTHPEAGTETDEDVIDLRDRLTDLDDLAERLRPVLHQAIPEVIELVVTLCEIPQPGPAFTDRHGPLQSVAIMFEDGAVVLLLDRSIPTELLEDRARHELAGLADRDRRGFERSRRR